MGCLRAEFWGFDGSRRAFLETLWQEPLGDFNQSDYELALNSILSDFERETGKELIPGKHRKVALKVYTNSGPGIATPLPLIRALIGELENRGYQRNDIVIVDWRTRSLRESNLLPPISQSHLGSRFEGVPVVALEHGRYWDPVWFYESALPDPGRLTSSTTIEAERNIAASQASETAADTPQARNIDPSRQSYLPKPLLTEVDFWINLPVATDHPRLGLNGGLANATLWNASNTSRFFTSGSAGQVAIAEMAAIPELLDNWALTIMSLEAYQFIGGPEFNSLYTLEEPILLASVNHVLIDTLILERINKARVSAGFDPIPVPLPQLAFAARLGVGK